MKEIVSQELCKAVEAGLQFFPSVKELKPEQQMVIENIIRGKDVFAELPTGFGKSLTFQILPAVMKALNVAGHDFPSVPGIVVVSPLSSIVKDQVIFLRSLGFKAAFIGESDAYDQEILRGKSQFDFVFGSPETFLGDYRAMFSSQFNRKSIAALVCDEVHTVVHWGEGSKKKDPFRKWCGLVGELRSLLPQGIPVLALTATATATTRRKIILSLSMNNCIEIVVSPNRKNIKLFLQKVKNDIQANFGWLACELDKKGIECPRTLIYVKDFQSCSDIFGLLTLDLGAKAYWPNDARKNSTNRMVAMYHSGTMPKIQDHVLSSLKDPNGKVRIVIATSALGMGVDMKGLYRIISYGPPNDVESYIQAVGRAGRDGRQSEAILLYHGMQLRLCEPEMLEYLKSDMCRRQKLMELFDDVGQDRLVEPKHLCCDVCEKECDCAASDCQDNSTSVVFQMAKHDEFEDPPTRVVSDEDKAKLKALLTACQQDMRQELMDANFHSFYTNIDNLTCFSDGLVNDAVANCEYLFSVDDVLEKLCVWNAHHAYKILCCLKDVFRDLTAEEENPAYFDQ